jgi:hypothetical protein
MYQTRTYAFGEEAMLPAFQSCKSDRSFCLRVSEGGCSFGPAVAVSPDRFKQLLK